MHIIVILQQIKEISTHKIYLIIYNNCALIEIHACINIIRKKKKEKRE